MAALQKTKVKKTVPAFTLIEVLIASILIGIAIAALVASNSSFTGVNAAALNLSTAEFLVEEIRERTATVTYDSLSAFDDAEFSPPIDVNGTQLTDFSNFTQKVIVQNVDAGAFETPVADGTSDFLKITVTVELNGTILDSASWIRARQ